MDIFIQARALAFGAAGVVASMASHFLGGFDMLLQALVVFMAVDFAAGTMAAMLKCSDKSDTGRLSSGACRKGIIKKCSVFMIIIVAVYLDMLLNTNGITRDAVIIAFALNELLSIVENMAKMGVKLPPQILSAIDVLNKRK